VAVPRTPVLGQKYSRPAGAWHLGPS
jgi:hypothetical protein